MQVVDIVDLALSNMEQLESLEMAERGEVKKGREVIRVIPVEDAVGTQAPGNPGENPGAKATRGPHKVLMEDACGRRAWGFEMERVPGLEIGGKMKLGVKVCLLLRWMNYFMYMWCFKNALSEIVANRRIILKLVLKNAPVMRELVMLQPSNTTVLGGGIGEWDQAWIEKRKAQLEAAIGIGKEE